ncbi:MAG: lipopolysaccharide biosynthesis protein [Lachnospiraceae bacterium]|nr:lipopolysaccharide biosynthesis protein [Lachnospiraceae bacterium]
MNEKSRTEYSARNTSVAVVSRVLAILLGFVSRVVFTHTLSEDYVGINGLFTDILNVLALSELGVGTAITYALYKPIAEKDIEKQKSLMKLYQKFYYIVAGIVAVAGLLVIPFMDILIKDQPAVEHLTLIYLMYLTNSVVSYLLIYKKTLIEAHQLSYISVSYQMFFQVLHNALQIVVLLVTRNYILYLSMLIICTIAGNICISRKAEKMYPYLKDKNVQPLPKEERDGIFQNIRAMLMHKVGTVIVNNTDNLLLSALVGTLSVGRYSNYYLVIGSIRQVLNQVFQGITASVGNMGVEEKKERIRKIFEATFFVGQWMYGMAAICLYVAIDLFVGISFGEQYIFTKDVTLILCLNFYLTGMRQATLVFRDSMGLFRYDRYKSLAEALINLVVSLILGKYMGTIGVFIGTMISTITTSLWVEPYVLYKYRLKTSVLPYFGKYLLYAGVTFALWFGVDKLCDLFTGNVWMLCIARVLVALVTVNIVYLILYHRTKEFGLLWQKAMGIAEKKRRKGKNHGETA